MTRTFATDDFESAYIDNMLENFAFFPTLPHETRFQMREQLCPRVMR
jgi:hypothetical protein